MFTKIQTCNSNAKRECSVRKKSTIFAQYKSDEYTIFKNVFNNLQYKANQVQYFLNCAIPLSHLQENKTCRPHFV